MKIWEFIKQLEQFNQDDEVRVPCSVVDPLGTVQTTDMIALKPMKHDKCPTQNARHLLIAPREGDYATRVFVLYPPEKEKENTDGEGS